MTTWTALITPRTVITSAAARVIHVNGTQRRHEQGAVDDPAPAQFLVNVP